VLALVTMPVGLYHRIRAETGEKIDRWQEGVVILVGLRLTALVLVVVTVGFGTAMPGTYVAPHYEGGKIVPGHIEPAKP